jgi:DNA-binding beta-propeller fold protein YncE
MPLKALHDTAGTLEMFDPLWARGLYERKEAAGGNAYEVEYKAGRGHRLACDVTLVWGIGLHGEGSERRMAFSDFDKKQVIVVNMESGEKVASVGSKGEGPGQFKFPSGVAYSRTGELYVCDCDMDRILVFDREGGYVRGIGERGSGQGQLSCPLGLCFTADGNLVVADRGNHRVQVFREDGTFVRAFGSRGSGEGQFNTPCCVCAGRDGGIAVADRDNHRVQVFDGEGRFVRSIGSEGEGPGQFLNPNAVAFGGGGEIIVSDYTRKDMQVFSREGELLQVIGAGGDSDVDFKFPVRSFCADADGRLTVLLRVKSGEGDGVTLGEAEVVTLT